MTAARPTTDTTEVAGPAGVAAFQAAFVELLAAQRGREPAWLTAAREAAFARFAARGLPTTDDENWRFTSLRPLSDAVFTPAPAHVAPVGNPAAGAVVATLTDALARDADSLESALTAADDRPIVALAAAFATDGIVIRVPDGVDVREPLEIRCDAEGAAPLAICPRVIVRIGRGARLTLVETWSGTGATPTFTNRIADIRIAEGGALDHVTIVDVPPTAIHISAVDVTLAAGANYTSTVVTGGGRLVREDRTVRLDGEGASCRLDGLYFASGSAHADHHTVIDHRVPNTSCIERYKGVLDGKARGVFTGLIVVRPNAQKTSASQKNDNLLLSDSALAHSTPRLEIHADDVQCRHGSTIGQLEGDPLFYLRSRGISPQDARDLLTFAFANEVIASIRVGAVRDRLVRRWFGVGLEGDPS